MFTNLTFLGLLNKLSPYKSIIIPVLALLIGLSIGHFTGPAKVVTKTEIKTVEVQTEKSDTQTKKDKQNNKDIKITKIVHPDGTVETQTEIVDKGSTTTDTQASTEKTDAKTTDDKTSKTVTNQAQWQVNALAGLDFKNKDEVYGAQVERRILGGLKAGVFGLSNNTFGASLGLEF